MKVIPCPECDASVVACDNNIYLDYPAVFYDRIAAPWTLMQFGGMVLATAGDPSLDGRGHSLHEHQPRESVMA